jgi:hypothetical protein
MKRIYHIIIYAALISIISCQKGPYPYITKAATEKIDSAVHPGITNAAFIYKNDIYYVADFNKPVTQITMDGSFKAFVKLSHDHTKFAYQNSSGIIVVIDNKGTTIATLSQYTQVKSFDWSADDKTLYILNNNSMVYYGPSLNLPAITYPGIVNGSTLEVLSASVSMSGDFAYVVHGYNFIDGDKYELVIQPANKGQLIEYDDPDDDVYTMDYVNFSSNKQDLVVGYRESDDQSGSLEGLKFFTGLKAFPDATYGGGSTATPVYNSSLNYMVAGATDESNSGTIAPAALYLGPNPVYTSANVAQSILLTNYSFSGSNVYTDWK